MDYITGLPKDWKQHDSFMVVVAKLIKVEHFNHVESIYKVINIIGIFMKEIIRLHGMPKIVISHHDARLKSNFWKSFLE